ncbi:MAG TPA: hypothetical protein VN605_12475, partial [Thermoanaerobaculia bacterium]|nr:hypothetical protein [Thermoanaerobaculia bacterium]
MPHARIAIGSLAGALAAALAAPPLRGFFHVPTGAIGFVTIHQYPKGWDYAVVAMLVMFSAIGGFVASRGTAVIAPPERRVVGTRAQLLAALAVFVLMFFLHDHPYVLMDPFHEGEHLSPAFLLRSGQRPYADVFLFHGLGVDGGLDALVLGDPPSPRRVRRLQTVLDGATLALLVPIAAEVTATAGGMVGAVVVAFCAIAAGQLPVFPYFRFLPIYLAALGLLRFARNGRWRWLFLAFAASTLGVLLSVDTGLYALAGTALATLALRPRPVARTLLLAAAALALPVVLLLAIRADLQRFVVDTFVILPKAIDAAWALPARHDWSWESARYYLPPVFYGFLLAVAARDRKRAMPILIVTLLSLFAFRSAAGRCSWSHTRFGLPLFGVAVVAFVLEPLALAKRRVALAFATVAVALLVELWPNASAGAKLIAGWRARQRHDGLVAYPFKTGKGIYTTPDNVASLAALNGFIEQEGGPNATILDLSNEQALYYLLQRKPAVRCFEPSVWSAPRIRDETLAELRAHPPAVLIMHSGMNLDA